MVSLPTAGAKTGGRLCVRLIRSNKGKAQVTKNRDAAVAAEKRLADKLVGSTLGAVKRTAAGKRIIDVLHKGTAYELKQGRTSKTAFVLEQIAKDKALMADPNSGVKAVTWVFERSATTGKVGPTGPLARELLKAGIKIEIRF